MGEEVSRAAEDVVVKSERRENLRHVASDIMIRNSEFSSVDIDGILG